MRILYLFIGLLSLLPESLPANTDRPALPEFSAVYKLLYGGFEIGEIRRSVQQTGPDTYRYESDSNSSGMAALFYDNQIREISEWSYKNNQFIPGHYSYTKTRNKKIYKIGINFDWNKKISLNRINRQQLQLKLENGFLDRLLYQYVIMVDLMNGKFPEQYTVVDARKIKTYEFQKAEKEKINTPLGDLQTIRINMNKKGEKSTLSLWCSEEYHFLPIKIESTDEDGRTVTALINSIEKL